MRIPMSQEGRRRYARRQATMRKWGKVATIALFALALGLIGVALYLGY
jgi:hypothetical protein